MTQEIFQYLYGQFLPPSPPPPPPNPIPLIINRHLPTHEPDNEKVAGNINSTCEEKIQIKVST